MEKDTTIKNPIIEGVIWKQLLLFFFPLLFGAFFQQLYNTVDAVIVGRFVGTGELAAVGSGTSTLINIMVGLFIGISSGATVIVAQFYGAGSSERVSAAVHTGLSLAIAGGAVLTILGLLFGKLGLQLMKTPEDILSLALSYLRIYFLGMIPNLCYNISAAILRAVGDSRRPLYILIFSCLVNVVLDLVFVVWLRLSVQGVAIATVLSQIISAALTLRCLMKASGPYQLSLRKLRFYPGYLSRIFRIGLPAGTQSLAYGVSNIIIQSNINLFGSTMMASYTAYSKIDSIFWMMVNAFGISVATFVGQNFGARRFDRVRKSMRTGMIMTLCSSALLSLLLLCFGRFAVMLFTTDQAVIETGVHIILLLTPFYFTYVPIEIISGTCRSMGYALTPMIMTLSGICLFRLLWLFLVVPGHRTIEMVLASYPITWSVTSVMFFIYYFYLLRSGKLPGLKAS